MLLTAQGNKRAAWVHGHETARVPALWTDAQRTHAAPDSPGPSGTDQNEISPSAQVSWHCAEPA